MTLRAEDFSHGEAFGPSGISELVRGCSGLWPGSKPSWSITGDSVVGTRQLVPMREPGPGKRRGS